MLNEVTLSSHGCAAVCLFLLNTNETNIYNDDNDDDISVVARDNGSKQRAPFTAVT